MMHELRTIRGANIDEHQARVRPSHIPPAKTDSVVTEEPNKEQTARTKQEQHH